MRSTTICLCLCVTVLAAASQAQARELANWGRSCSFRGVTVDHGDELEGDEKRCLCDDGRWVNCRDLNGCWRMQWPPKSGCNFDCPENSCVKRDHSCVDDLNDCECKPGYEWRGRTCVKDGGWNGGSGGGATCMYYSGGRIRAFEHGSRRDDGCLCLDGSWNCGPSQPLQCWWQGRSYDDGQWRDDRCKCDNGSWSCAPPSGPKECYWRGGSYPHGAWRDNNCQCDDGSWSCAPPSGPKECFWRGGSYPHGAWRDNNCQCDDGSWNCAPPPPSVCWWEGSSFPHQSWRGNCQCDDGSWNCPSPPQEQGCLDDTSLPFGLENCICDGATVGDVAGLAACSRVVTECDDSFTSFASKPAGGSPLESVQRICDSFALDGCKVAADVAKQSPACKRLLEFGSSKCSARRANDIFDNSVDSSCAPLCPNCGRN